MQRNDFVFSVKINSISKINRLLNVPLVRFGYRLTNNFQISNHNRANN